MNELISIAIFLTGQLVAALIWGTRMSERVKVLEREMSEVKGVRDTVVRMEAEVKGLRDDFRDLNASIRWMREPAGYGPLER
jgi:hypothetical protein